MMKEQKLIDFQAPNAAKHWKPINDSVMGGLSESTAEIENNLLHFSGEVSLANNGGFAMIRAEIEPISTQDFNCFKLRLKGDGKRYQFRVKESVRQRHSYIHHFETTGNWQSIHVPFESLKPWFRGNQLDMDDFKGPEINAIAFLIANKTEESFQLQIESISLVHQ